MSGRTVSARARSVIPRLFEVFLRAYGPQGWWPIPMNGRGPGFDQRGYHPGIYDFPRTRAQRFEIVLGAILTQNTAWTNVEKALSALAAAGVRTVEDVLGRPAGELALLIRPSGYYNQKAKKLLAMAEYLAKLSGRNPPTREELLSIWGVGEETADSILLYAFRVPVFVVDAYTRRLLHRIGLTDAHQGYGEVQRLFASALPADHVLFDEYHALIVRHAKEHCTSRPICKGCPVPSCRYRREHAASESSREGRMPRRRKELST